MQAIAWMQHVYSFVKTRIAVLFEAEILVLRQGHFTSFLSLTHEHTYMKSDIHMSMSFLPSSV